MDSRQKSVKFENEIPFKPFAPVTTHLDIVKENKIMRYQLSDAPQKLHLEDDMVVTSSQYPISNSNTRGSITTSHAAQRKKSRMTNVSS